MLMTDDNNYRLARMQETLLKVATGDRRYHLDNYIKNVTVIDAKAFDELVDIVKDVDKHNQTLEEELAYLEKVKNAYEQVLELQMRFRRVCEEYGGEDITLSDMSILNIGYIEDRINVINGYLINIKNIEKNKRKLEDLNDKLINEEKKKDFLTKKILLFEKKLRDDFVYAKLKQIISGKLESFDVTTEYSKLGYDVISLMDHPDELDNEYKNIDIHCGEVSEKYEAAKLCYNSLYNTDSKAMMSEVEKEFYLAKYKYIMLKLLKLVCNYVDTYELAKVKRENFVELINNRNVCLEKLGMKNPINIVNVVDIDGQLVEINELSECIKIVHVLRKDIVELSRRTEDMVNDNNNYLISLTETKELIRSKVGLSDVDITTFDDIVDDVVEEEVNKKEVITDNQVVGVKGVSSEFKLILSKQKAYGVIDRIYQMNFKKKTDEVVNEEIVPELVLCPKEDIIVETEPVVLEEKVEEVIPEVIEEIFVVDEVNNEEIFMDNVEEVKEEEVPVVESSMFVEPLETSVIDDSIFETTTPFEEPVMFLDRSEDITIPSKEIEIFEDKVEDEVLPLVEEPVVLPSFEEMPDAFWVNDNNEVNAQEEVKENISFDEQIDALLASTKEDINVKRKVI